MISINLALCCDDNYARHLGVALCSVLHNLSAGTQAAIYIVHNGLQKRNKDNLEALLDTYKAAGTFIEVDPKRLGGLVISRHITPAAYIRIALPDLLPPAVSRILYVDCDIIAREDITALAAMDIGEFPLGAIPEGDQFSWSMNELKHHAGIPHDAVYFNSGVLLLNLDRWRAERLSEKIFSFIREKSHRIRLHDQDALNIFFHGEYKRLDHRWNYTVQHLERPELYAAGPVSIAHFITDVKPWHARCDHPLRGEYYKYFALTPWAATETPVRDSGADRTKAAARFLGPFWRKIVSIRKARRAIRSRTVFRKEEIAELRTKFALKSMFINAGLMKSSREAVLGSSIRFPCYEDFIQRFDEVFVESRYYFNASSTKPFIVDCSGDFGMAVLYYKLLYPYSEVLVFEPDALRFAMLRENVSANNLEDVQLRNSAPARMRESTATKQDTFCLPLSGQDTPDEPPGSSASPYERLSCFIDRPVDFLKIGGSDPGREILEDLSKSGALRFIRKIALTHHHYVNAGSGGLPEILKTLEAHGFSYHLQMGPDGLGAGVEGGQRMLIYASRACT